MLDIEYLDTETKGNILLLREFIRSNTYKEFLKHYELGRISFSMGVLSSLLDYAKNIDKIIKKLNRAATIIDNEILILYKENNDLHLSLYFNFYSLNVENTKELIKKYFKDTDIIFNDLNVEHDKIVVVYDLDILKEYFEI